MQLPFHLRPKSLAAFFLSSCSELTLFYIWAGGQKLISQIIPDGFPPNFVPFTLSSDHQANLFSLMLIVPHQSNHSSLKLTGTHVGLNKICPTETPLCSISCWPQLPLTPRPTTCVLLTSGSQGKNITRGMGTCHEETCPALWPKPWLICYRMRLVLLSALLYVGAFILSCSTWYPHP